MTKLEETLGPDGYAELKELVRPKPSEWLAWLKGSLKSWTNWFGAALLVLPEALDQLAPDLMTIMTEDGYARLMRIIGVVVIVLRFKTTKSLKER